MDLENSQQNETHNIFFIVKVIFVYLLIASHIFILPNDILDRLPFLNSYVEFMKEHFEIIKQIEIRTTKFPQSGALWGVNMIMVAPIFITCFVYSFLLSTQNNSNFLLDSIRQDKILIVLFSTFILWLVTYKFCTTAFSGDLFDTQIRLGKNPNAINSKFGLFFKGGALYLFVFFWIGLSLTYLCITTKIIFKKIKNLIAKFNTKDKK
ncbi:hypothetical protein OFN97_04985 [Campylobacter sp. VBCF_05 NA6]|nr:hypothetical protein [Campylobacter sp. VBCF_04 NA7]MDA3059366.1 hypothetical protein [Campylobacter sp. VBCF_05 NA6]